MEKTAKFSLHEVVGSVVLCAVHLTDKQEKFYYVGKPDDQLTEWGENGACDACDVERYLVEQDKINQEKAEAEEECEEEFAPSYW